MSGGGGNSNTTISHPGANWQVLWGNGPFGNFQLDIVGFLAVLGEGSVLANAQVSALSSLFYLPRLIPAPQALLWPSRPVQLEPTKATVTGVESGVVKDHVHHVANILLGDEMPPFAVRCVQVTKAQKTHQQTWKDRLLRGEQRQRRRAETMTPDTGRVPAIIKAKANGPTSWVTILSFGLSVVLFTVSLVWGDGMSLIATLLLSSLSTLIGVVNKWSLKLPQRPKGAQGPKPCHVVVRYPNGSFLVVKCDDEVARELYFAPEEIEYSVKSAAIYRLTSLAGTLMLMGGVIALANAKLQLQFAWAGAYIITNAAHFIAAAVPPKLHWDLSCYQLEEQGVAGGPYSATFTEGLWKTIILAQNAAWVRNNDAAPRSAVWDAWLDEAEQIVQDVDYDVQSLIEPNEEWPAYPKGIVWSNPHMWQAKAEWDAIKAKHDMEISTTLPMAKVLRPTIRTTLGQGSYEKATLE